ncbi:cupin domain-containing protein [Roseimarinus sediminis]|jgi:mannose-6-phosphate isomerase-like protein (cupin superfamily)|uniref:cupin domain-containing protein n=1 Tax=Roseimarinus sediminis TaxID=1610899 RepID=UPI003D200622
MDIKKVKEQAIVDTPHKIDVRRLYDKDSAQVMHMTLQPGETLKPHITPVDVFFFILEGSPDVRVGDETITVEANSLVDSPKGIIHCLSNNSQSIARILVVKAPKPVAQSKLL